ncbi:MAG TPA: PRC and DUF2382 domain-containing protein [Gaiellaceae bacterium]|nr:PRC and DUF2382 domain-containing protein [Gaiellaceae bacterium]
MEDLSGLRGSPAFDAQGEPVGVVEDIFVDQQTSRPEWIRLGGGASALVPVQGAQQRDEGIMLAFPRQQIEAGPSIGGDELSMDDEAELAAYYGLDYTTAPSETGLPDGAPQTDQAPQPEGMSVTRSEEELAVGKQSVQTGHVRLRKWVETEPVALDVELRQEAVRVTSEPIDQPVADAAIGEEEIEVELRGERPVVEKQVVAKERIGLEKDVEVEHTTVRDEVRRERVELDGDR